MYAWLNTSIKLQYLWNRRTSKGQAPLPDGRWFRGGPGGVLRAGRRHVRLRLPHADGAVRQRPHRQASRKDLAGEEGVRRGLWTARGGLRLPHVQDIHQVHILNLQRGAKMSLPSLVGEFPPWQLGCALAALGLWVLGRRENKTLQEFFWSTLYVRSSIHLPQVLWDPYRIQFLSVAKRPVVFRFTS